MRSHYNILTARSVLRTTVKKSRPAEVDIPNGVKCPSGYVVGAVISCHLNVLPRMSSNRVLKCGENVRRMNERLILQTNLNCRPLKSHDAALNKCMYFPFAGFCIRRVDPTDLEHGEQRPLRYLMTRLFCGSTSPNSSITTLPYINLVDIRQIRVELLV
jgi:hypothetical protein